MNEFTIREARPEDIDAIYDIFKETDKLHRDALPDIFQKARYAKDIKDYYQSYILISDAIILLAELQGDIIGALICSLVSSPDIPILVPRVYGCVENITVAQSHHNRGKGKGLMERSQQWAIEKGATGIELTVWGFNQVATRYYHRLGYNTTRSRMVKDLP
jgi:ribosomal protein S18 acetylase RimI-like enzyme